MKIIVLGTRGIPDIQGGVETHCEELYPRLVSLGHDITIITRTPYVKNKKIKNYKGVKLKHLYAPRTKTFEAITHNYLHIHTVGPMLLTPIAKLLGLKVIVTNHGPDYNRQKWGKTAKRIIKLGERLGTKYADKIIVISKVIDSILKNNYDQNDAVLIYNGVTIPAKSENTDYIGALGLTSQEYIIAVGRFVEEKGFLVKTESYINKVGTSERTKAIIEPRLSDQWFLKMEGLVKPAIKAVLEDGEVKLFPKKFENTYRHWMENIRDWNISRQLWWGQQIPAYFYGDGKEDFVVAESREEAFELAKNKTKNSKLKIEDLKQDNDALDTWFSSWLWPMSVFDGIRNPDNDEFNYYYPTNDLVTGPDILFFWVARMIIAGYEYTDKRPFENVYLTGLVRDKQRRKMSKSLGNSPDALKLIEEFGADGVRVGLLLSAAAGNDLMFDETLCQQGKGFANKIWNAFRLGC
jgi:hypothetical protein